MRVLILCNDFPPLNSIGARRPHSWFLFFKKHGIEPIIITKDWQPQSASPGDVINQLPYHYTIEETFPEGKILRVPNHSTLPEKMMVRFGDRFLRPLRRILSFIYRMLSFVVPFFDKHHSIYQEAKRFLQTEKADVILITGEPFILFKYGFLLSKKFQVPWVADYRDCWRYNHVARFAKGPVNHLVTQWEFLFEKKYIVSSSLITTADRHLSELLNKLHAKPIEVIYNGFDRFYKCKAESITQLPLVLTHSGTITPGQQVEFFLKTLLRLVSEKNLSPADLQVKFLGLNYYPDQQRRIQKFNGLLLPFLQTTLRLSREETLQLDAASDFLLVFSEIDYPILFAKTYDYISVKKTILVIPGDGGQLSNVINDLNAGYSFYNEDALAEFLFQMIQKKKSGQSIAGSMVDEQKAQFFTREHQAAQMANVLKKYFSRKNYTDGN